jgi:hypothetical protein
MYNKSFNLNRPLSPVVNPISILMKPSPSVIPILTLLSLSVTLLILTLISSLNVLTLESPISNETLTLNPISNVNQIF